MQYNHYVCAYAIDLMGFSWKTMYKFLFSFLFHNFPFCCSIDCMLRGNSFLFCMVVLLTAFDVYGWIFGERHETLKIEHGENSRSECNFVSQFERSNCTTLNAWAIHKIPNGKCYSDTKCHGRYFFLDIFMNNVCAWLV